MKTNEYKLTHQAITEFFGAYDSGSLREIEREVKIQAYPKYLIPVMNELLISGQIEYDPELDVYSIVY